LRIPRGRSEPLAPQLIGKKAEEFEAKLKLGGPVAKSSPPRSGCLRRDTGRGGFSSGVKAVYKERMRWIYLATGWLALGLGIAGIFLPLLPTTPFVLLAAFCFGKASPELHARLLAHPKLGPPVRNWQERRVIPLSAKLLATLMLVPLFLTATIYSRFTPMVNAVLLATGTAVLLFLWTKKSR